MKKDTKKNDMVYVSMYAAEELILRGIEPSHHFRGRNGSEVFVFKNTKELQDNINSCKYIARLNYLHSNSQVAGENHAQMTIRDVPKAITNKKITGVSVG